MNFGLYIHWPFCIKKCPYCDFNTYTFEHNQTEWIESLLLELEHYHYYFPNYTIDTIFFGGGTPSLIKPNYIKQIIEKAFSLWKAEKKYTEITLETNPSSVESHELKEFMNAGINRFSIGIQSLDDSSLKFLGRVHNVEEALRVLKHACNICDNVSADFIYALPKDTLCSWKKNLIKIEKLIRETDLKHISLYQLTIEENTQFAKAVANDDWQPLNNTMQSKIYRETYKKFKKMYWDFYEISNIAKNSHYHAQHNLKYWRYENYLGIGPGAHSRMMYEGKKYKFNDCKAPFKWLNSVKNYKPTYDTFENNNMQQIENLEELPARDLFIEELMLICRINKPISMEILNNEYIDQEKLKTMMKKNFISMVDETHFKFNLKGKLLLNSILKFIIK